MSEPTPREFVNGSPQAIARRNLTEDTCRKWGYWMGSVNGQPVQIANIKQETARHADRSLGLLTSHSLYEVS